MPTRPKNVELRTREYLTSDEIEALMAAARGVGRHGHRDATLILTGFRRRLRVSELVAPVQPLVGKARGAAERLEKRLARGRTRRPVEDKQRNPERKRAVAFKRARRPERKSVD